MQSTADRPTGTLDLWEHAVREKSDENVTVELSVPRRVLDSESVKKRAQRHEVKLSTPGLRHDAGNDEPSTVVLEGGYTDVKAVWKNMYYVRSEPNNILPPNADLEALRAWERTADRTTEVPGFMKPTDATDIPSSTMHGTEDPNGKADLAAQQKLVEEREKMRAGTAVAPEVREQAPRRKQRHFAWVKLLFAESDGLRATRMLSQPAIESGCKITPFVQVGIGAGKVERVARLLGNEDALKSTIERMQQVVATGIPKAPGTPAAALEVIQMGLKKDMVDFKAFIQSLEVGAPAPLVAQSSTLPQQTRSDAGAAEQAQRVVSSSTGGKITQDPARNTASPLAAEDTKGQPKKQSDQQLSDDMRSALRYITQPVALVTACAIQQGEEKRKLARGVTVSSFCTVTLHPKPIISFNLRVPSRSWDAISESGNLRVHLLKASPEGATVAHAFTLPYEQPHEPFEHLSQSGLVKVWNLLTNSKRPSKVPRLRADNAIYADFIARIMPEKCIEVGDHMIVVAEVTRTLISEDAAALDAGALAYGMKGYRQLGGEIKPMDLKLAASKSSEAQLAIAVATAGNAPDNSARLSEQESVEGHDKSGKEALSDVKFLGNAMNEVAEPAKQESAVDHVKSDGESPDETNANHESFDLYERFAALDEEDLEATPPPAPRKLEDLGPSSPMLDEESLRQVLEENEAAYSSLGLPHQTAADNPMLAEALRAVSGAYNDTSASIASSETEQLSQTQAPLVDRSPDTVAPSRPEPTSETHPLVDHSGDPAAPSQPQLRPWTEAAPVVNPAESTTREDRSANALSATKRAWGMDGSMTQQIRKMSLYRTLPRRHFYSTNSDSPNSPPISKKILKTTVADYLAQMPTHKKRYTNLIKLQRSAERFEARLQQDDGEMTEEQAAELSGKAQVARRKVSRELALRNAMDLRAMLDKGRVATDAAQWLETNLEHGQVVLLDEAKVLRKQLEDGKLRVEDFEKAKAELTRDYEAIDVQLMRLRDFAEDDVEELDDEDGFEKAPESVEEKERSRG